MVIYRTTQDQMNDILAFGMSFAFTILMVGLVKSLLSNVLVLEKETSPPMLPQVFIEGGEPLSPQYRYLSGWIDEPLPEYSLATLDLLPQVEAKERKIDAILQQLKKGVETIQRSENFRQFLLTMSKFHDYSIGNQILIMLQKPDATKVAGFNTWKELGRWVKKGEKGIAILAPVFPARETVWQRRDGTEWTIRHINREWGVYITRTAEGQEPNILLGKFETRLAAENQVRDWGGRKVVIEEPRPYEAHHFVVVYVFDLSQTERVSRFLSLRCPCSPERQTRSYLTSCWD